jgi:putative peptidoglycan lipid II flippase
MTFMKAIATVGGLTLVSRFMGFARDILMAIILGAGPLADAFFIALKIPNVFRRITAEGALSIAFVPVFSETLEKEGQAQAQEFAQRMLAFLYAALIPFTVLAILFMPYIIAVIAPGFDGGEGRYETAVELTRITFPYLLFMSLTALIGGMLNAHNKYAPFAAAPILFNFCLITALIIHSFVASSPAHALATAVSISGFIQFIWVLYFIRKCGYRLKIVLPKLSPRTKKTLKLMVPAVMGAGVVHINLFVDVMLASLLPAGSISYLYYADRLAQLPLGVIGIAIGTALLPMMSKTIAAGDVDGGKKLFRQAMIYSSFFSFPAAMALIVIAFPTIYALFAYGAFTENDARACALVLVAYAVGLPAYIAAKTYASSFYARQDTKTPLILASISAAFNIGLSLVLIRYWGVFGLAFATSCAGWLQLIMLFIKANKVEMTHMNTQLAKNILKLFISAQIMALSLWLLLYLLPYPLEMDMIARIMVLSLLIACGLVIYISLVMAFKVVTIQDLKDLLRRKVKAK